MNRFHVIFFTILLTTFSGCLFDKTSHPTQSGGKDLLDGEYPSISPDGTKMAYVSSNNLYVCSMLMGSVTMLSAGQTGTYYPRWSSNGSHIAFIREVDKLLPSTGYEIYNALFQVDVATGNQSTLAASDGPFGENYRAYDFDWSPSGNIIECFCDSNGVEFSKIYSADENRLVMAKYDVQDFQWSPDGNKFVCSTGDYTQPKQLYIGYVGSTTLTALPSRNNPYSPRWFADGIRIAYTTPAGLILLNTETQQDSVIAKSVDPQISISPDSRKIAYFITTSSGNPDESGWTDLYSIDVATGVSSQLVTSSGAPIELCWAPSSREIFFSFNGTIYTVGVP